MKMDDELAEAKEAFALCAEAEADNREAALDDLRFARLGEQWPDDIRNRRAREMRPCLTINRLPSFIRQVVNDARQNKPSIKVKPVDSASDPATAEILNGLIRNIEYTSNADIAYDTAAEFAVTMGIGYIRIGIEYACDDNFDKDLRIQRVANPFSIYGDPHSTAADSSDWNMAFVVDRLSKETFRQRYKDAEEVDWNALGYGKLEAPWLEDDEILVAERWLREEVPSTLLLLSNGLALREEQYLAQKEIFDASLVQVVGERPTRRYRIRQTLMTGAEILETNDWAGRYIPIIPVYGEEVNVEGKRWFRSLIRDAKDAQQMHNYWRTCATELVALAPKAPFIGAKGSFDSDIARWETANTESHPFLEYDPVPGQMPPQRQPFAGPPAGALNEALLASDDMKAIMGLYDASLGARSNETSGVAIRTRQRQGDIATFHFIDNLQRGIRHAGRVLLDLIPAVYNTARIVRVLGQEGEARNVAIAPAGAPSANVGPQQGFDRVYDVTLGKYDVAVESGPAFSTQREEAVSALIELIRAYPPAATVVGDLIVKMMDFPNAAEVAARLQQARAGDPEKQKMGEIIQALQAQLAKLSADKTIEAQKAKIDAFNAETDRLKVMQNLAQAWY